MTKLDREFQHLLSEISDKLITDNIQKMVYILRAEKIPAQDLETVKTGENVFHLMTKHGLLSKTKTQMLIDNLKKMRLQPIVDMLEEFKSKHEEELKQLEEGPCNIKEDMVVEHFMETSKLKELEEKLRSKNFVTLSGLLGSGKSQLALKYACQQRKASKDGVCWRISCQDKVSLLNSLKKLADGLNLKQKSKQIEGVSNEESLNNIHDLILHELRSKDPTTHHLIIFDDVTDKTKLSVEKLKNSFLKMNMTILATTWNSAFCDEANLINVNGFTKDEAVQFLKKKDELSQEEYQSYRELAEYLSCLPLAMYGVKTRLVSHKLTPRGFLKNFTGRRSLEMIDGYLSSSLDRKLFGVLTEFLNVLKRDEVAEVFDMVLILQFLSLEDIPILLFQFLPANEGEGDQGNQESFIEAMQKFSLGLLRGEDDERFINTHLAVTTTIDEYTSIEDKVRLLKKVLTSLMWLLDKDNINDKDYKRNNDLLPHAISVIRRYEMLREDNQHLLEDFELNVLVTYVYDLVGYTYNFFGMLLNAGEYSTAAKNTCFVLIGMTEAAIEEIAEKESPRDENYKSWEHFARCKAKILFEKLQAVISNPNNQQLLQKMALAFIINKYRGQEHIDLLEEYLEHKLKKEYTLSKAEYNKLCKNKLAIAPENHLGEQFIYELILQVFYTFGRRIFYLGDSADKKIARVFTHSLFLAREFGVIIEEKCKQWNHPKKLYVMSTELSGTLEQLFDDRANLKLKTFNNLEHAASRIVELQETESSYFIFGIIKTGPDSLHHRKICLKRLVRCYTALAELTTDEEKRREINEKAHQCNTKLAELSSKWPFRQTGADLRMGECFLMLEKYEEAELQFRKVAPVQSFQNNDIDHSVLNFHELRAIKGLIKCYDQCERKDEAKALTEWLKARLHASNEVEELAYMNFSEVRI
ncbi:uncharacterized protein LOC143047606 [Mytilus galloprovincialis]|uniref:uncharacterized protein LOC143047606 n=1 Tax=Mytilus galloprovincialis TaxID=29158 RepID=UPI003F7BCC72